jgi:hypothetical protein
MVLPQQDKAQLDSTSSRSRSAPALILAPRAPVKWQATLVVVPRVSRETKFAREATRLGLNEEITSPGDPGEATLRQRSETKITRRVQRAIS